MRGIYKKARKGEITKSDGDRFFSCFDEAVVMLPKKPQRNTPEAEKKSEINKMSRQVSFVLTMQAPTSSVGEDVSILAELRQKDMISDLEFQVFSERFKMSTGEKASDIIRAISELYEQRQKGALSVGNFHAALWSLLDKLDRKT
ncbi:MAG: hypothetical protein ACYSSP_10740 [Planctomycetota bacterium]